MRSRLAVPEVRRANPQAVMTALAPRPHGAHRARLVTRDERIRAFDAHTAVW